MADHEESVRIADLREALELIRDTADECLSLLTENNKVRSEDIYDMTMHAASIKINGASLLRVLCDIQGRSPEQAEAHLMKTILGEEE